MNRSIGWLVAIGAALALTGAAHAEDGALTPLVDEGGTAAVVADESAPVPATDPATTLPPGDETDPTTSDQVVPTPSDDSAAGVGEVVEPTPAAGETVPDETVPSPEATPAEDPAADPTPPSAAAPENAEAVDTVGEADPLPGVVEPPPETAAPTDPAAEVVVETEGGGAGQPQGSRPQSEDRSAEQAAPAAPAESAPVAATSSTPPVSEGIGRGSEADTADLAVAPSDAPFALAVLETSLKPTTFVVEFLAAIDRAQAVSARRRPEGRLSSRRRGGARSTPLSKRSEGSAGRSRRPARFVPQRVVSPRTLPRLRHP